MERTLVMIKPNGVRRHLVGEIISRFEKAGLAVTRLELKSLTVKIAGAFYAEHRGKPFFKSLIDFMTSGPIVAMAVEGRGAVLAVRAIIGATDPKKALPGTLRHDYAKSMTENLVHASDSPKSAARELAFHFGRK